MHRLLLLALCAGCATNQAGATETSGSELHVVPSPAVEQPNEPFRVISPKEPVPPFRITTTEGALIDSRSLRGKPFMVVFFASWCSVCALKLPEAERALEEAGGDVRAFVVSVDDTGSWPDVAAFRERSNSKLPLVRGQQYERFALAWDPFQTVPVVAVVGKNGYLVDYQIGFAEGHFGRLVEALRAAQQIPTDARPPR